MSGAGTVSGTREVHPILARNPLTKDGNLIRIHSVVN